MCAVGAGLTSASPLGTPAGDALWLSVFGAGAAYFGSTAKRLPLLFAVAVALVGARTPLAFLAGLAALGFVYWSTRHVFRRGFLARGLGGGFAVISVLSSATQQSGRVTALLTVLAIAPVVLSGYRHASEPVRRRSFRVGLAAVCLCLLGAAGALLGAQLALDTVDAATIELNRGFVAAREGRIDDVQTHLDRAEQSFAEGRGQLGRWGLLGRAVPLVGQHVDALSAVSIAVEDVTQRAASTAAMVETDDVEVRSGRIDVGAIAALENPLRRLALALDDVVSEVDRRVEDPLVGPLQDRLARVRETAARDAADAHLGADAAAVAPAMLGGEEARRYLVLFTSPAEARGRFGFPGSFAEVEFVGGRMVLGEQGTTSELLAPIEADQAAFDTGDPLLRPYLPYGPTREFRSVTIPPDFPTAARAAATLWEQSGRDPVDGVVRFAPAALAPLLDFTGPVELDDVGEPLTGANLEEFLVFGQYLQFQNEVAPRREVLDTVAEVTFQRLQTADLPGPRALVDRYAPLSRQQRFEFVSFESDEAAFLERLRLSGRFPPPPSDSLMVTTVNSVGNKIDTFLSKAVRYDATIADGQLEGTVEVELTNGAPASGLPGYVIGSSTDPPLPPGTNRTTVFVYTQTPATGIVVDGDVRRIRSSRTGGRWLHEIPVELGPGTTSIVELRLSGSAPPGDRTVIEPGGGARADVYEVEVREGARVRRFEGPVLTSTAVPGQSLDGKSGG